MNNLMTTSSQFKDLNEFLAKHSAKNERGQISTHTRIPDKDLNIYGHDPHTHYYLGMILKIFVCILCIHCLILLRK